MTTEEMLTHEYGLLVGRSIAAIRPMTIAELEMYGWEHHAMSAMVIVFDNGSAIVPSADPEGNGPGHLFLEFVEEVAPA